MSDNVFERRRFWRFRPIIITISSYFIPLCGWILCAWLDSNVTIYNLIRLFHSLTWLDNYIPITITITITITVTITPNVSQLLKSLNWKSFFRVVICLKKRIQLNFQWSASSTVVCFQSCLVCLEFQHPRRHLVLILVKNWLTTIRTRYYQKMVQTKP